MAIFSQSAPAGSILAEGDKFSPTLVYVTADGTSFEVPNIWYNQPAEWRVEVFRFYASQHDDAANRQERAGDLKKAEWLRVLAAKCRSLADEMEKTGKTLA